MLTERELQNAFAYFGVTDAAYMAAMQATAASIREDARTMGLFRTAWDAIFGHDCIQRERIEPLAEELCGENAPPYITFLLLLAGCGSFRKKQVQYHLTGYDIDTVKQRIRKIPYNRWRKGIPNIWFELFLWIADFLNGNETYCGSLIFQRCSDELVQVHIPTKADLSYDMVRQSLRMAPAMLRWRYGLEHWTARCESWLLSPELQALCRPGSNIARFSEFFQTEPGEDCTEDILRILFKNHSGAYSALPEDTSLQRAAKAYLLQGGTFRLGNGILQTTKPGLSYSY